MNQSESKRRQIQDISRILALITVLIIGNMAGNNGLTYLAVAFLAVSLVWIAVGGAASDTLGRLLRSRAAKGQYKNVEKMKKCVFLLQAGAGLAGTLLLFFGSEIIGKTFFKVQYSVVLIAAFSPIILLRSISSVLMGYCQGEGNEMPTAAASLLRQIFNLVFCFIFCHVFQQYGDKVSHLLTQESFSSMYVGVGAAVAVSVSELFVILFLLIIRRIGKKSGKENMEGMRSVHSTKEAVGIFAASRLGACLLQLVLVLPFVLGFLFFWKSQADAEQAAIDFGTYAGKYLVCNGILFFGIKMLVLPLCSRSVLLLRRGEQRQGKLVFQNGIHAVAIHAAFWTATIATLANPLAFLLDNTSGRAAAMMLRTGAGILLLTVCVLYFGTFLILTGRRNLVTMVLTVGVIVFIPATTLLLNVWQLGVFSLVYAYLIGMFISMVLLGFLVSRQLKIGYRWLLVFEEPIIASCLCVIIDVVFWLLIGRKFFASTYWIICLIVTGVIYWVILLAAGDLKRQELDGMPGGKWLLKAAGLLRIKSK